MTQKGRNKMTAIREPHPTLLEMPITELVDLVGQAHKDHDLLTNALKHRMTEAKNVMSIHAMSKRTGYTRPALYNWLSRQHPQGFHIPSAPDQ